jgi:hypothetical protein
MKPTNFHRLGFTPAILALLIMLARSAEAQFVYTNDNDGITITKYTGPGGAVTIPDMIDGLPVTRIGDSAFGESSLTAVVIPDGVTGIGNSAFSSCYQLAEVTIGDSVTNIGYGAFSGCTSLASIVVPDNVVTIEEWAFFSSGLSTVSIGDGVTSIGRVAFSFCSNLRSITLGSSVRYIGDLAFTYCTSLRGLYFKGNAPELGVYVFEEIDKTIVYYLPGTTGWESTFGGRVAVFWNPRILTSDSSFGVRAGQFGFTINGSRDLAIVVEACTDLAHPVWTPLGTNTLAGGSSYFSDSNWVHWTSRVYRLRARERNRPHSLGGAKGRWRQTPKGNEPPVAPDPQSFVNRNS